MLNLSITATLKRPKIVFQDQLSLNAGQTYGRMLHGKYSAISYHLSLRSSFCLFLSGLLRQPGYCNIIARVRITKALIRLRGCSGWYASLLVVYMQQNQVNSRIFSTQYIANAKQGWAKCIACPDIFIRYTN